MVIELTTEEAARLELILRSYLGDLRMEIADTEQKDYRDNLKRDEELVTRLLARLQPR